MNNIRSTAILINGIVFTCLIFSCTRQSLETLYIGAENAQKVADFRRNSNYVFLQYRYIKPTREEIQKHYGVPVKLNISKKKFHGKDGIALYGRSTSNTSVIDYYDAGQWQRLDSVHCAYGQFMILRPDTIQPGNYRVKARGCRYNQEFEITVR